MTNAVEDAIFGGIMFGGIALILVSPVAFSLTVDSHGNITNSAIYFCVSAIALIGTVASLICFNFLLVLRRNFGYF